MKKLLQKRNGEKDNKGFTLVELIVVIAVLAILAVALTPRLTHYIDKARQANDHQVVDTVGTAIKLGILDDNIYNAADNNKWIELTTKDDVPATEKKGYNIAGTSELVKEIKRVVGDSITLQSDEAKDGDSHIFYKVNSQFSYEVVLTYKGTLKASPSQSDIAAFITANESYSIKQAEPTAYETP